MRSGHNGRSCSRIKCAVDRVRQREGQTSGVRASRGCPTPREGGTREPAIAPEVGDVSAVTRYESRSEWLHCQPSIPAPRPGDRAVEVAQHLRGVIGQCRDCRRGRAYRRRCCPGVATDGRGDPPLPLPRSPTTPCCSCGASCVCNRTCRRGASYRVVSAREPASSLPSSQGLGRCCCHHFTRRPQLEPQRREDLAPGAHDRRRQRVAPARPVDPGLAQVDGGLGLARLDHHTMRLRHDLGATALDHREARAGDYEAAGADARDDS